MGWVVNATPRSRVRNPEPIVQEAEWTPRPVSGAECLGATEIRSPDLLSRSESLYWVSYHGRIKSYVKSKKFVREFADAF